MGYRLNRLTEPVFIAVSKLLLTEFGIHYRLESCAKYSNSKAKLIPKPVAAVFWDFFVKVRLHKTQTRKFEFISMKKASLAN